MTVDALVDRTVAHMRNQLERESSGHDWWHVYRVWRLARHIALAEGADTKVVELAALLHDIADWKFHDGDESANGRSARDWLIRLDAAPELIDQVCDIVDRVSFRGGGVSDEMPTHEGQIVQDADRLDAIGAVGIARVFAFGGFMGRPIYDPDERPAVHATAEMYKRSSSASITHFYEKLLLLRDRMHTDTARRLAEGRHQFMEEFLSQFYTEWHADEGEPGQLPDPARSADGEGQDA